MNGKIWIEFDDGDSGFFQLDEIRRIHPNFPAEGKTFFATLDCEYSRHVPLGRCDLAVFACLRFVKPIVAAILC